MSFAQVSHSLCNFISISKATLIEFQISVQSIMHDPDSSLLSELMLFSPVFTGIKQLTSIPPETKTQITEDVYTKLKFNTKKFNVAVINDFA